MIVRINHIETMSVAKILGITQFFVGFVSGTFFTFIALVDPEFIQSIGGPAGLFGAWSIAALPLLNGTLGFLSGYLLGWTYNTCARILKTGIKIDIESNV